MFHRADKKIKSQQTKPLNELTAMVSAHELLACPKRQELLEKLNESNLLEPTRYHSIGLRLIHNLVNYCQRLPETENSYYAHPGGLFDHALNRTEAAMSLWRQHTALTKETVTEDQALWSYVLFSASLLKDVGKLQTDFCVNLYDTNGQLLTPWNPLLESMIAIGSYYHHQFQASHDEAFRYRLTILFSKLLMPSSGFSWIASNPRVLNVWLGLLANDDESGSGTLKAILSRADDIAIQRELNALLLKMQKASAGHRAPRIGTFVDVPPESNSAKQNAGIKFIRWVQKELALGNLIINKGPLRIVPGGMIMSDHLYKLFVQSHPEYKKWQIIRHGFISLGMYKISRDGAVVLRNDLDHLADMENSTMLDRASVLLPDEVKMLDASTGKVRNVSAVEIVHIMFANEAKKDAEPLLEWRTPPSPEHTHILTTNGIISG